MAKETNIQIRTTHSAKAEFQKWCNDHKTDMSSVINAFIQKTLFKSKNKK